MFLVECCTLQEQLDWKKNGKSVDIYSLILAQQLRWNVNNVFST